MKGYRPLKPAEGKDTYSLRELAYVPGISTYAARKLVHQPGFPATSIQGRITVPRALLPEWLKSQDRAGLAKKGRP